MTAGAHGSRSRAIAALERAIALEAAVDEACAEYAETTGEQRYRFAIDAIVLLADRVGLLEPQRTARLLEALAALLANTTPANYEAAKAALAARAEDLLAALGEQPRRQP